MVNKTRPTRTRAEKARAAERQLQTRQALYEIADAAGAVTDMQSFYKKLHEIVGRLMHAKSFYVTLYDPITHILTSPYFADARGGQPPPPTKIDETNRSLRDHVLLEGMTLHLSAAEIEEGTKQDRFRPMGTPAEDWVGVPLRMDGQIIGSLTIQSYEKGICYDESDVQVLQFVAQHIAIALTRARAIEEIRQRNAELAIINSVQEGLASQLDIQSIYQLVGEKIRTTFNAQVVSIATYDHATQLLCGRYYFEGGQSFPGITLPSFGFRKWVIEPGQPLFILADMPYLMEKYENPVIQGVQPKSAIFIPMPAGKETIGVISLQNNDQENAFTEADVRVLTTLASSMSVALENARLWEQEKIYRKSLEREMEIGREIQTGFLPDELPAIKGWEIAASLMPAREVAGDFYDAFELPDGNIGLVIADVCDKGVGAALFMTLFRSLIRITANQDTFDHTENPISSLFTPERLQRAIRLTNNYIAETHHASGMFATLFFGILDPQTGQLIYINGGHEPPLIVRLGHVREPLYKTGPALGAIPDCHFDVRTVTLDPGEMFFAFTDGVPEVQDPHGEFFGHQRLFDILLRCSSSSPELVQTLETALRQYMDGATQFDDITLLAVRRMG